MGFLKGGVEMRARTRILSIALLTVLFVIFCSGVVFADGIEDIYEHWSGKSVGEQISQSGSDADALQILREIEQQVSNVVATIRVIATIAAVIFFIWLGVVFFTSGGNPQRLAQAKTQVAMFFVSLICIFAAEPIVRFILSWFMKAE